MRFLATWNVEIDARDIEDACRKAQNCREYGEFDQFQVEQLPAFLQGSDEERVIQI